MTDNPAYTQTVTQTTTLKDVYGSEATVKNLTPEGYIAIDFRPVKTNESYVFVSGPGVDVAATSTTTVCRLIVKKAPEPIVFNPSIFGPFAAKKYGTEDIILPTGNNLIGFSNVRPHIGAHYIDPKTLNIINWHNLPEFSGYVIWVENSTSL